MCNAEEFRISVDLILGITDPEYTEFVAPYGIVI
jgi:hypothetical protein